ncbi:MAG: pilus assembly protein PilM [Patescibacteria group bacterium]|jgi:type IV pilus assembly protein PilM
MSQTEKQFKKKRANRQSELFLDVGAGTVRLMRQGWNNRSSSITIENPADKEEQNRATAEALNTVFGGIDRRKRVATLLPSTAVFSRVRHLSPALAANSKLRLFVEFELLQQIPFSLDQIIYDFDILDRDDDGGYEVLIVAVKRDVALQKIKMVNDAGYRVNFLGVNSIATYNWLNRYGLIQPGLAVVDVGCQHTEVLCLGKPYAQSGHCSPLFRSISLGGADITSALSQELGIAYPEAEKGKMGLIPLRCTGPAVQKILSNLVSEISRSIAYFNGLRDSRKICQIWLTGEGSLMPGIDELLKERLGVEVDRIISDDGFWIPTAGLNFQYLYPEHGLDINLAP